MTGIAFVGTGFVADYYMTTLANHPALGLTGVFDRSQEQLRRFADFYGVRAYASLDEILADAGVDIVVNLTNPESHYDVSRRALEAGKHVYSEKPLAMHVEEAEALAALARAKGLSVAAAPANALSAAHATVARSLQAGDIGRPRLIYAEMEDGAVFRERWQSWRSRSGATWPGLHEFEIGCTLEHAGYALTWLVSLLGPIESMTTFSALAFADKGSGTEGHRLGPDFSLGCLNFRNGCVARITSGLSAPKDRSLTILGDKGTLTVRDLWDHTSSVRLERTDQPRRIAEKIFSRLERRRGRWLPLRPVPGRSLPVAAQAGLKLPTFPSRIDFCGGIAAQAEALKAGRQPFFSGDVALHITEAALMLSGAGSNAAPYRMRSTFSFPTPPAG